MQLKSSWSIIFIDSSQHLILEMLYNWREMRRDWSDPSPSTDLTRKSKDTSQLDAFFDVLIIHRTILIIHLNLTYQRICNGWPSIKLIWSCIYQRSRWLDIFVRLEWTRCVDSYCTTYWSFPQYLGSTIFIKYVSFSFFYCCWRINKLWIEHCSHVSERLLQKKE